MTIIPPQKLQLSSIARANPEWHGSAPPFERGWRFGIGQRSWAVEFECYRDEEEIDSSSSRSRRFPVMPSFGAPFSGLANERKLTEAEVVRAIRFMVAAEYEAV